MPFPAITVLREHFGFVPKVFSSQSLVPCLVAAEVELVSSILFSNRSLTRARKECILLAVAEARENAYCFSLHYQMLKLQGLSEPRLNRIVDCYEEADLAPANKALWKFALKLAADESSFSAEDMREASSQGLTNEALLDAVVTTALGVMLCTLATGLCVAPDFGFHANRAPRVAYQTRHSPAAEKKPEFYLPAPELAADDFAPFLWLREQFGFVPSVFLAQTLRRDVLEAEVVAIRTLLATEEALTRAQKERLLLAAPVPRDGWIERDPTLAGFARKLSGRGTEFSRNDIQALRANGFTDRQVLEAVVTIALAGFFAVLRAGLGAAPDFEARRTSLSDEPPTDEKKEYLPVSDLRHSGLTISADADAECVARVRGGDLNSFEELMTRHSRRVYRTLIGILGNPDDARDAMQDTFLKAFQHLARFEGRSRFSTWLLSIASNTAIQRLRDRRPTESIGETGFDEEIFRPHRVHAWADDPERLYSKVEARSLIEGSVMKLPAKYRVVLMLRDIEQLPVEDTSAALGLSVAATKARLLRGRLMLREALAPHFAAEASRSRTREEIC